MARPRGQIIPRGPKCWLVRWPIGIDEKGRYQRRSKVVRGTKQAARKFLTEQLHRIDSGSYVEPLRMTLSAYLDDWLDNTAKLKLEPRTLEGYRWMLKRYVNDPERSELGVRRLDGIRPPDIQRWVNGLVELGLSGTTVRKVHAVLSSALKQGVRMEMLLTNPAAYVELPKLQRAKARPLTAKEVQAFRRKAKETIESISRHEDLQRARIVANGTTFRRNLCDLVLIDDGF